MGPNYYYQPPVAQKPPSRFNRKFVFIIAGCVVALIIAIVLMLSRGPSLGDDLARAVGSQARIAAFCSENQSEVRDQRLAQIAADASLFFTTDAYELGQAGGGSPPEDGAEVSEEDTAKLEEAANKGRFDQTFVSMLEQKIDAQQALMREIATRTQNPKIKAAINRTYTNLELIRTQLDQL